MFNYSSMGVGFFLGCYRLLVWLERFFTGILYFNVRNELRSMFFIEVGEFDIEGIV